MSTAPSGICSFLMRANMASFVFLPLLKEPLIEGADGVAAASGDESSHIDAFLHLGMSAPDSSCARQSSAVPTEGGNAKRCGYLAAVGLAEFWEFGEGRDGGGGSNVWNAAQKCAHFRPGDVRADAIGDHVCGPFEPVLFGGEHAANLDI